MHLRLRYEEFRALVDALARAGQREIGGQMFGEQIAPSQFQITELTVQSRRGTIARFVVDLVEAARTAFNFFQRTGHDYARFNYIGEWHSHPRFDVRPSSTDTSTMREMVTSVDFRGSFAVLMIVRLDGTQLRSGAWLFDPKGRGQSVKLEVEDERQ